MFCNRVQIILPELELIKRHFVMFLNFVGVYKFDGGLIVFYDVYLSLCTRDGKKPSVVAAELGINKSNVSNWKNNGYTPRGDVLQKIADYFHVTTDYLLSGTKVEKTPALTEKDKRDVARDVNEIMENLAESGGLMFDGVPMSDEARAAMAAAMRIGLEEARRRNKETYTPKKYRGE